MKPRNILVSAVLVGVLLLAGLVSPVLYDLEVMAGRLVLLAYSWQLAVRTLGGAHSGLLDFLAGVGGLLYTAGVVAEWAGLGILNGRDLDFLVRVVGLAFLVLPALLAALPRRVRHALQLGDC